MPYHAGMTDNDRLERFADLVVRVGANVQPGSFVLLRSDIAHLEIARAVVERAYVAGAAWVEVDWSDGPIRRSQLTHTDIERLTRARPWVVERTKAWAAERGVSITLVGDPDPHLLDDVDPAKVAAFGVEEARAYREAVLEQQLRWTVVAAPNPGWAAEVFGEPDMERLWDQLAGARRGAGRASPRAGRAGPDRGALPQRGYGSDGWARAERPVDRRRHGRPGWRHVHAEHPD